MGRASEAAVKALEVPMGSSAGAARPPALVAVRWDGAESPWVRAAEAAAPWPAWALVAAIGIPGASLAPRWLHGGLALALIFGAMVVWSRRPAAAVLATRWIPAVLGTGLMAELLANALTDMGRERGLSGLEDLGRAMATWLICAGLYEVAPMIAAASRLTAREHRARVLDLAAHAAFVALALAAYAWEPRSGGWYVSPWIAALVALPLAAVRCGPPRTSRTPAPRRGALWGLAIVAWLMCALVIAGDASELARTARRTWRWGTDPLEGALWALPALSFVLSLAAAASLLAGASRARRAPSGAVTGLGDRGVTLERPGEDEPTSVAIDEGPLPPEGATITLVGARERGADVGPFRDGAPRLRARRAFAGTPEELARALRQRAAGWIAWAAVSALGVWLRLL